MFAFNKKNFWLMLVSLLLIVVGFALMAGGTTTLEFNPEVFSFRRITLAPIVCMTGFVMMIFAILWRPKN